MTFVGNATTVLRLGDFTLLTDPAFGAAGSRVYLGYGAWARRVEDPALQPGHNRLLPDVMGSVVELEEDGHRRLRLYVTGDTLFGPHLEEIPRRFGEIDAMLIHLGGTRLLGILLTMDDRQGVETTHLIRAGLTLPIHFDDYSVFKSPLNDYLTRARDQGLTGIQPIGRGDTVELPLRIDRV